MTSPDAWVIVPAKTFLCAKQRLSPFLTTSERATLARTMLADVLKAACSAPRSKKVAVVTGADDVAREAAHLGAVVIDDAGANGTNEAITAGLAEVENRGGRLVIALPSDVPAILSEDVSALLDAAGRGRAVLVRATRDGGTNALASSLAGLFAPCFGPNSFARHIAAANRIGIKPIVSRNARIGLDLDRPGDLFEFLDLNTSTATDCYLRSINLAERRRGGGAGQSGRSIVDAAIRSEFEVSCAK
ncbi:2-phospho-L-lactate guanylyltransferase [Bradyrhizobium jicamae]|uniref:2-phospho-L-lactate guanylyltransferase n=1 Tax=Bradyrhizobium jicamae TaxID=280332 RepID=UPI0009F85AC0|nr:2-phospho-L-lactate guanylyltransferase [Bradyrhizobium jicamae]